MRKAFRHTGVLMMVAVVALGLLGAAYTLWYENLTLQADISTGTFDADWSCEEFQTWTEGADGPTNGQAGINNDQDCKGTSTEPASSRRAYAVVTTNASGVQELTWYQEGGTGFNPAKATQSCAASISTDGVAGGNDAEDNNSLTLTLNDLYPFTGCEFSIDLHNDGTTPLHLSVTKVETGGAAIPFLRWTVLVGSSPTCKPLIDAALAWTTGTVPVREVQLHHSDEILCNLRLWVEETYTDAAGTHTLPEGSTGNTITLTVMAHQWNEQP